MRKVKTLYEVDNDNKHLGLLANTLWILKIVGYSITRFDNKVLKVEFNPLKHKTETRTY